MHLVTYLLGFLATFAAFSLLNASSKPGEEMSMPTVVISSIIWPIALLVGIAAGAFRSCKAVYNYFKK